MLALPASHDALEAMCTRTFSWAAPEIDVKPLGSTVLLVFTDVAEARCADPLLGSFTYREATFFVPIWGTRNGVPFAALHVPFIYPNEGLAVAAGREVYGLPKKPAFVEMPNFERLFDGTEKMTVEALAAARFDGGAWSRQQLLSISSAPHGLVDALADAFLDALDGTSGAIPAPLGAIGHLFEQQLVQLKQVADVTTHGVPPRVLYRSITNIKAPVRNVRDVRLADASKMLVKVADLASEPIAQVLGLSPIVTPSLAATLTMDFHFEPGETWLERPVQPNPPITKTRVLVLGGGMGAFAVAHALTDSDARRAQFDVTVASQGHYLGGKGANLRDDNPLMGRRIEEHGIHVIFGFYHNALRLFRKVYAEVNRPPGVEPNTFDNAFSPQWKITFNDGRESFEVTFPRTPSHYGAGPKTIRQQVEVLLDLLRNMMGIGGAGIEEMILSLLAAMVGIHAGNRVAAEVLAFTITLAKGVMEDVILGGKSWDELDAFDFRAWMHGHHILGFPDLRHTAIMQVPYDGVFAYEGHDQSNPVLSAGVAARGLLKLVSDYERSPYNTMNAGMGETIFMPMYEVLQARGVKFDFFARVKEVRLNGGNVEEVVIARQAVVKPGITYNPVELVNGIRTWRRHPDDAQLDANAIHAEDPMSDAFHGQIGPDEIKRVGTDFDWIVCALPAPVTAHVLRNYAGIPALEAIQHIPTVATLHLQTWFDDSLHQLGWPNASRVLGGFPQPLNSMLTDETILSIEPWPAPRPRGLLYMSGPFGGGWSVNSEDPAARVASDAAAYSEANTFVTHELPKVLTNAVVPGGTFDFNTLHAPLHPGDRMKDQYVRGNIDRAARYVLMKPGTLKFRPPAYVPEVRNLVFAGDWLKTGVDIPCIEGCVTGSLQAANAILPPDDQIELLW